MFKFPKQGQYHDVVSWVVKSAEQNIYNIDFEFSSAMAADQRTGNIA